MKTCSKCQIPQAITEFYKDKGFVDGHSAQCKTCKEARRRLTTGAQKRDRSPQRFWKRVDKTGECWLWTGAKQPRGYGKTQWEGKFVGAHVLAWFLTHGTWPTQYILHHCDTPPCCNPEHLFEGTAKDNAQDRDRKNRGNMWKISGEKNYAASVTNKQAEEIRLFYASGQYSQEALGRMYNTSRKVVYFIIHNHTYLK